MRRDTFSAPPVPEAWFATVERQRQARRVLELRGVSVRYGAGSSGMIRSAISRVAGRPPRPANWALRRIDLTIRAGECLGVIGRNGAGKSTLLRVMAGLLDYDAGRVRARGRISSLLHLGVGFDAQLTGRENVNLAGSLMGLSRRQTRERAPKVIEFAELGAAIDAPLRTYSSGMRARLGFATAAHLIEPEILLLDEVMGTGDASFRERSRERIMELVQHAHAVVVASHDMQWISEYATYGVLLDAGTIIAEGAPTGVTTLYRARSASPQRPFGCPGCAGAPIGRYCSECGVLVHAGGV